MFVSISVLSWVKSASDVVDLPWGDGLRAEGPARRRGAPSQAAGSKVQDNFSAVS